MLGGISHLTFDCYGTLIDWERGILGAVRPWLDRAGATAEPEAILRSFVHHEARLEGERWRPYREVLRGVMAGMAVDFGLPASQAATELLVESLPGWPPFPDTVRALERLGKCFQLCILSNTDDALFAETQKRLGVRFAQVVTAEQVRSYKPGQAHFREGLRRLGVPVGQVLHVAQSLYHDHAPARALGFRTAWVNRPSMLPGTGLAPAVAVEPDLTVADLDSLVTILEGTEHVP